MDQFSSDPIQPGEPRSPLAARLLEEWRDSPLRVRVFLCVLTGLAGVGCLYGGYAISHESPGWVSWLLTILILEPLGVACLLSLLLVAAPTPFLGFLFSGSIKRARGVVIAVGIAFGFGMLVGVAFVVRELWRAR